MADPVHILVLMPLKYVISSVIRYTKGKSSLMILINFPS